MRCCGSAVNSRSIHAAASAAGGKESAHKSFYWSVAADTWQRLDPSATSS